MDGLINHWQQPEPAEGELTYMYQRQQEGHAGMQQHFADPSFQSVGGLSFGAVAPKNEPAGQLLQSLLSFGGKETSTISFSRGSGWPDSTDGVQVQVQEAPERRGRALLNAQEHVMAERKRSEKMQQLFVALATIVPDLTKTDKITILGSTVEYVKKLEEKVKSLEEQSARRTYESTVLESKHHISTHVNGATSASEIATGAVGSGPVVEASAHGDTILLKMCCVQRKGVLVTVFGELENQGLSLMNTSVLPITDSCFGITVTAKIGEGYFNTDELVNNLAATLRGFT